VVHGVKNRPLAVRVGDVEIGFYHVGTVLTIENPGIGAFDSSWKLVVAFEQK